MDVMTKPGPRTDYQDRLSRVTAYIYDHLDDELDLQKLAEIACLSPYHWHRVYHAVYGETIVDAVKRLRLQRAAAELAHTETPIAKIAMRSGYGSLPAFTRSFRSVFGMPPGRFRRQGSHTRFKPHTKEESSIMYEIEIKTVPPLHVAAVDHDGSYLEIGRAFDRLFGHIGPRGLATPSMRLIGIYFDDPTAVPEARLRSRAGIVVDASTTIEPPLSVARIEGGPYAVLRHKGPYADMKPAYQWLFGEWLTRSGREAADAPVFEEYLNSPRNTAPTELRADIYLPLKPEAAQ
ncbi:AraC family transcriptional regulator [Rhizobiales bacterium GAS188]|nr:AraC family transcriptional regulator [Rhizobiales bacterium GAS188]